MKGDIKRKTFDKMMNSEIVTGFIKLIDGECDGLQITYVNSYANANIKTNINGEDIVLSMSIISIYEDLDNQKEIFDYVLRSLLYKYMLDNYYGIIRTTMSDIVYDKLEIKNVNKQSVKFTVYDAIKYHKCESSAVNKMVKNIIASSDKVKKLMESYIINEVENKYNNMIRKITK